MGRDTALIDQTIDQTVNHKNWDFYRDNYLAGNYSQHDLMVINDLWYDRIKEQVFFDADNAREFFRRLKNERLTVLELGCYRGELAEIILSENDNIESWAGFDICSMAIKYSKKMDKYTSFIPVIPFYNFQPLSSNTFICTHTIEHFSTDEVIKILDLLKRSATKYIYFEAPLRDEGKIWKKGASSHVLQMGKNHFRKYFKEAGWSIIFENQRRNYWAVGVKT